MRILLLSILLVSINILFAQEINYSIEFGPTIPLNMWNITKIYIVIKIKYIKEIGVLDLVQK